MPSQDQMDKMQALEAEIAARVGDTGGARAERHENAEATQKYVDSASEKRTVNNTMRHQYKVLSDAEKAAMLKVKDDGLALHAFLESLGGSRELSLAKTKVEEAVMWAVKHITG